MSITVDPTYPPDIANPRQVGFFIRNLTAEVLQLFGFSGTSPVTLTPPVFSKASPGYCQFPNGLIVQWGTYITVTNGATIILPTPFSSASTYAVVACPAGVGAANAIAVEIVTANTLTVAFTGGPFNISLIAAGF